MGLEEVLLMAFDGVSISFKGIGDGWGWAWWMVGGYDFISGISGINILLFFLFFPCLELAVNVSYLLVAPKVFKSMSSESFLTDYRKYWPVCVYRDVLRLPVKWNHRTFESRALICYSHCIRRGNRIFAAIHLR